MCYRHIQDADGKVKNVAVLSSIDVIIAQNVNVIMYVFIPVIHGPFIALLTEYLILDSNIIVVDCEFNVMKI